MVKRKLFASSKPDVVIEVDGNKLKIHNITSLVTLSAEFTLDEPYENDFGGEKVIYITTMEEGSNKLVTKLVDNGKVVTKREFTDTGFVQTMYGKSGVKGTRTFKRVDLLTHE